MYNKLVGLLRKDLDYSIQSLFINFIDNASIQKINKEYLNHNYSTDIITFNYSGSNVAFDGEIFISIDDAQLNAKKYKISLSKELKRLIIHGILHLKGYDDIKSDDRIIMKKKENYLLNKYNFTLLRS
ncbi:MAG: rRNA maturation RNase YbeY [Ignavibacterium sp.]|nr:MAG: rRNA maturation RNase YbeY [Ignavibacterium sp.]